MRQGSHGVDPEYRNINDGYQSGRHGNGCSDYRHHDHLYPGDQKGTPKHEKRDKKEGSPFGDTQVMIPSVR